MQRVRHIALLVCISGSLIKNYVQVCVCPRWYFTSHKKTISQDKPRFPLSSAREKERKRRREMFWSFYIITSCRSFVRNKILSRSLIPATWKREREKDQAHRREQNLYACNAHTYERVRARARPPLLLSNSRVMTRLTYKWKSGL